MMCIMFSIINYKKLIESNYNSNIDNIKERKGIEPPAPSETSVLLSTLL